MGKEESYLPLFETKQAKGRILFYFYTYSVFVGIFFIFIYRFSYLPLNQPFPLTLTWIGLSLSDLWFVLYWFLTVLNRWNPVFRYTFKDRLSLRFEKDLPGVDVFVCTADPKLEPPIMVMNTVLSVMAYDYPPEKLSVYLSDDGCCDLTFYAMLEASSFAKIWLPFCRKFKIEPRSPEAYFKEAVELVAGDSFPVKEWLHMKKAYSDMSGRIESTIKQSKITEEIRKQHKGFLDWDSVLSHRDHPTILQIIVDGKDSNAVDAEGNPMPTLVYLAREKRPNHHHNFKAGAMNALIRVSSSISNGPIIMNVDCDMYSNNAESVRDALCFLMDEEQGHRIAYVQYPQNMVNLTKNDLYSSSFAVIQRMEMPGLDGNGGTLYIGTGCFHRREVLFGKHYSKDYKEDWKKKSDRNVDESKETFEENCRALANCIYEKNTQWGKEMGLMYGFPVEDVVTGLRIIYSGWKSINFFPKRSGFLGLSPTTLLQSLVQFKRWSEGHLQLFLSKYCTLVYGIGRISLKLRLSYCTYSLWAVNCFPTLYYVVVPSLCMLRGISLFPKISSPWALPFVYVIVVHRVYTIIEYISSGGTFKGWWNDQRMWVFRRTTSFFFAFLDNMLKLLGFKESAFVITGKVAEEEVSQRYEQEVMEFGAESPMFTILTTIALLNAFSFVVGVGKAIRGGYMQDVGLQILLCGLLICINLPVYQGIFFRNDKGSMPISVTYRSTMFAILACSISMY